MRRATYLKWAVLALAAALLTIAAKYLPYFPGDVAVTRWVQALAGGNTHWAAWLSNTAKFPALFVVFALVALLSWPLAGWRGALAAVFSLAGMLALGAWLGPVVARPRPSPELVRVVGSPKGFGFPSHFALHYAATFGFLFLLAWARGKGLLRAVLVIACGSLLVLGGAARITLGAHWPSDVAISYLIALLWGAALIGLLTSRQVPLKGLL